MGKLIDLTGRVFGKLVVLKRVFVENGKGAYWECVCECTGIKIAKSKNLIGGKTTHCGCINNHIVHGKSTHRLHNIWNSIKDRCNNINSKDYPNYGGRKIKICEEWNNYFVSFYEWSMNNGYKSDLSIDRINVNGNYEPNNCKWSTPSEQQNNKRNTRYIEIDGIAKSITEWSKLTGVNKRTLWDRYNKGLRGNELLKIKKI